MRDAGIGWAECHTEDRGDGVLVVVPATVPTRLIVDPVLDSLAKGLRRHNRRSAEAVRVRLRVALHVGPVIADEKGVSGQAIIHTARLLEAPVLKERIARTGACLGFITSVFVYEEVIRNDPGDVDPARYRKVGYRLKESDITAWMHLIP